MAGRRPGDHRPDCRVDAGRHHGAAGPSAVVVAITPFGTTGPYVDARSSGQRVHLLQALCGSIGGRGWPGSEPMQAGGRIGEWLAGTFAAAVAAAASARAAADRLAARPSTCRSTRRWSSPWAPGRDVGQRARRCSAPGPAQPGTAVDRADRRRDGRVLHHHRATVSGLPGADRSRRPARRRRSGVDGRSGPSAATNSWPWFTHWAADKTTARDRRTRSGFPDPGGPDRDARRRS